MTTPNNILIRRGRAYRSGGDAATVFVEARYNSMPVDGLGREVATTEVFDLTARNMIGNLGAFSTVADAEDIEAAVAEIRAEFGDIPVQNNVDAASLSRPLHIVTIEYFDK